MSALSNGLRTIGLVVGGVVFVAIMMAVMLVFPFALIRRASPAQVLRSTNDKVGQTIPASLPRAFVSPAC